MESKKYLVATHGVRRDFLDNPDPLPCPHRQRSLPTSVALAKRTLREGGGTGCAHGCVSLGSVSGSVVRIRDGNNCLQISFGMILPNKGNREEPKTSSF